MMKPSNRTVTSTHRLLAGLICLAAGLHAGAAPATKSIRSFVSCSGTQDDTAGATKAFAAARNGAFTLLVDCPVLLHSGLAIDRSIFIDNGTSVEFTPNGKFIVDNMFHPAFVIADSSHITLTRWNVEWDGVTPIDGNAKGYEFQGKFVPLPTGKTQPAGAFNDQVITPWLAANRGVVFDRSQGWITAIWAGGVNTGAVFFISGDASDIKFDGLKLYAPPGAGGDHFLPMGISFFPNWKANTTVTGKTPHSAQFAAVPHGISFSNVYFDGTLMAWQGNVRDATFTHVESHRYADLQDAAGGTSGGVGKWYPPPHLFYLNYDYKGDPGLFNANIHISNVEDLGPRVGVARDKGGADGMSGYALSLKLGCDACSVDHYKSLRPDGFMDVLQSNGVTVSDVDATYDSAFLNGVFPGLRFPASEGYRNVTFENVVLRDTAAAVARSPIGDAWATDNDGIRFKNVQMVLNNWPVTDVQVPKIVGKNNDVDIDYVLVAQKTRALFRVKNGASVTLKATPSSVAPGGTTVLSWTSKDASACTTDGEWSGAVPTSGSKQITVGASGDHDFSIDCRGAQGDSAPDTALTDAAQRARTAVTSVLGGGASRRAALRIVAQ